MYPCSCLHHLEKLLISQYAVTLSFLTADSVPLACLYIYIYIFATLTLPSSGGGITNLLYKLQGPETEAAILVRIYGEDTDVLIDRERDNALFDELARCAEVEECLLLHLSPRPAVPAFHERTSKSVLHV